MVIFAILGMQLFMGSLGSCTDESITLRALCIETAAITPPANTAITSSLVTGSLVASSPSSLVGPAEAAGRMLSSQMLTSGAALVAASQLVLPLNHALLAGGEHAEADDKHHTAAGTCYVQPTAYCLLLATYHLLPATEY